MLAHRHDFRELVLPRLVDLLHQQLTFLSAAILLFLQRRVVAIAVGLQQPRQTVGFGGELLLANFRRLFQQLDPVFEPFPLTQEFQRLIAQVRNARFAAAHALFEGFDLARGNAGVTLEKLDAVMGILELGSKGFALLFKFLALPGEYLIGLLQRQGPDPAHEGVRRRYQLVRHAGNAALAEERGARLATPLIDVALNDFAGALVPELCVNKVERRVLSLGEQLEADLFDCFERNTAATRHDRAPRYGTAKRCNAGTLTYVYARKTFHS